MNSVQRVHTALRLGTIEIGEQVGGGAKQYRVASEHGGMGDVFGN